MSTSHCTACSELYKPLFGFTICSIKYQLFSLNKSPYKQLREMVALTPVQPRVKQHMVTTLVRDVLSVQDTADKQHLVQNFVSKCATLQVFCDNICCHCWLGSHFSIGWSWLIMPITDVINYIPVFAYVSWKTHRGNR